MSSDVAFVRELLAKVEAGECCDVLCIVTSTYSGQQSIVGPGLDKQLAAIEQYLKLTPEARARMEGGAVMPTPQQAGAALKPH